MKTLIIGNILAGLGATVIFMSLSKQNKKDLIRLQILECIINICAMFLLGGIAGCVTVLFALIRNILVYKNKFNKYTACILTLCLVITNLIVTSNMQLIGYLPILAGVVYTLVLGISNDIIIIKKALFVNILLWMLYSICIIAVPNIVIDIIMLIKLVYEIYFRNKNNDKINLLKEEGIKAKEAK